MNLPTNNRNQPELVVLVHGLCGSRLDMWRIAQRLKSDGFEVSNWGYRSIGRGIETHADRLGNELRRIDDEVNKPFHLVTHSMGGIIARTMFNQYRFENLGRVVMLAPPHRGSHAATTLLPWLGWLTPSLGQLSDQPDSFVNRLPNSLNEQQIRFGIIRAAKDRVIAPPCVLLHGYEDLAEVDGHHGILPWYAETVDLVSNFVRFGEFRHAEEHPKVPQKLSIGV